MKHRAHEEIRIMTLVVIEALKASLNIVLNLLMSQTPIIK